MKVLSRDPPYGGIARVDFFDGTNQIGAATRAPYSVVWDATAGSHSLEAVATDLAGNTNHAYLSLSVTLPTLRMSSLSNSNLLLSWPGGGTLLTAETLDGPWFYQRGVTSPYTINATVPQQFYWLVADDPMGDLAGFSYFAGIGIDPTLAATGYWHARPQPCAGQLRMLPIGTGAAGKSLAYVLQNVGCEVNFVITGGDSQSDSVPTGGIVSGFSSNATGMFVRCNGSAGSCDFKVWFVVGP